MSTTAKLDDKRVPMMKKSSSEVLNNSNGGLHALNGHGFSEGLIMSGDVNVNYESAKKTEGTTKIGFGKTSSSTPPSTSTPSSSPSSRKEQAMPTSVARSPLNPNPNTTPNTYTQSPVSPLLEESLGDAKAVGRIKSLRAAFESSPQQQQQPSPTTGNRQTKTFSQSPLNNNGNSLHNSTNISSNSNSPVISSAVPKPQPEEITPSSDSSNSQSYSPHPPTIQRRATNQRIGSNASFTPKPTNSTLHKARSIGRLSVSSFPLLCYLPSGSSLVLPVVGEQTMTDVLKTAVQRISEFSGLGLTASDVFAMTCGKPKNPGEAPYPIPPTIPSNEVLCTSPTFKVLLDKGIIPSVCLVFTPSSSRTHSSPTPLNNIMTNDTESSRISTDISFSQRTFTFQLLVPGGQTLTLKCQGGDTLNKVTSEVVPEALRHYGIDLPPLLVRYLLTVPTSHTTTADSYISIPTQSTSHTTSGESSFIEYCRTHGLVPKIVIIEKPASFTKQEKKTNVLIGSLIGKPLSWAVEDLESINFRRQMTRCQYLNKHNNDKMPPVRLNSGSLSSGSVQPGMTVGLGIPMGPIVPPRKVMVQLHLPLLEVVKTVMVEEYDTADTFTERMYKKHYEKRLADPSKNKDSFILKIVGLVEYIYGDYALPSFEHVKKCLENEKKPELALVEKTVGLGSQAQSNGSLSSSINGTEEDEEIIGREFMEIPDAELKYSHEDIQSSSRPWDSLTCISIWELKREFRFRVIGVENILKAENSDMKLYIVSTLYHGGDVLGKVCRTSLVEATSTANPRWYEWMNTGMSMTNLPRATRVCFSLYGKYIRKGKEKEKDKEKDKDKDNGEKQEDTEEDEPLAWVNCQLIDYKHELKTGVVALGMWPDGPANPIGTCVGNSAAAVPTLYIEFERYSLPVVFPTEPLNSSLIVQAAVPKNPGHIDIVDSVFAKDPLYTLTEDERELIWAYRQYCQTKPKGLSKFLSSVPYHDCLSVQEMHKLLKKWAQISALDSLELLDSRFADEVIRDYAVSCLKQLSDGELFDCLLQLVQVLKYEPYHYSALARFLVERALSSHRIGHSFFWYLKSEMHVPEISERFGLLLEAYLRGCEGHREDLGKQNEVVNSLVRVANMIKPLKDELRKNAMIAELEKIKLPSKFQLPLNPRMEVNGFVFSKCKYMDSKKLPLWLVFSNADPAGAPIYVIFKSGDDLRQDMLTLQMIQLMDKLWQTEGLDLKMSPYGCISTGDGVGMIEVVLNSETTAHIFKEAGGASAALFKSDPLANYIKSHNNSSEDDTRKAVENFIRSCAGYCVATYVLGIGDRHNDNVMVTKSGKLFHIDFGHFLGNYKKKFGFKRERAPFVFTPDFAYVMGGEGSPGFAHFVDLCCQAYNILRKHSSMFINLFAMMLSTGIPELQSVDDIYYLRDAFSLGMSDQEAKQKFTDLIYQSLNTRTTQINNAIHIIAHS